MKEFETNCIRIYDLREIILFRRNSSKLQFFYFISGLILTKFNIRRHVCDSMKQIKPDYDHATSNAVLQSSLFLHISIYRIRWPLQVPVFRRTDNSSIVRPAETAPRRPTGPSAADLYINRLWALNNLLPQPGVYHQISGVLFCV